MSALTPQERLVLDKIIVDPFIEQQDLANALGLSRSTVANHIARLIQKGWLLGRAYHIAKHDKVVCFGGAVIDRKYHAVESLRAGTSNPVSSVRAYGGVARNVAETLARLQISTSLVSSIGDDEAGRGLIRALQELAVDVSAVSINSTHGTAEYAAILHPDNSLAFGIADMDIFETLTVEKLNHDWPRLMSAAWVFADCNLPAATLGALIERSRGARFQLAVDAVSLPKVVRLPDNLAGVAVLFVNLDEAAACLGTEAPPGDLVAGLLARGAAAVVLTMGAEGLLVAVDDQPVHLPALAAEIIDVTGAGDSLVAGTLFGLLRGRSLVEAAAMGRTLAKLTLESDGSVPTNLDAVAGENTPWTV